MPKEIMNLIEGYHLCMNEDEGEGATSGDGGDDGQKESTDGDKLLDVDAIMGWGWKESRCHK